MRLFICGGGSDKKTILANKKFNEIIDNTKPLLYIPLALDREIYDSCYEWITGEMKNVNIPSIDMIRSAKEIEEKDLNNYSAIFIGGGNTFKLLSELKSCNAFNILKQYIQNDGIIFGGSAGATILGKDINVCLYVDNNEVLLKDTTGFDVLNGISIAAHYTNGTEEENTKAKNYINKYVKEKEDVLALSEEVTLYIDGESYEFIGEGNKYYFNPKM